MSFASPVKSQHKLEIAVEADVVKGKTLKEHGNLQILRILLALLGREEERNVEKRDTTLIS